MLFFNIVLEKKLGRKMEGVNSTMIYCKNFCKCHIVPQYNNNNNKNLAGRQWLTPVILTTQEAEIRRLTVQSQPRQIVCKTLSGKTLHKHRAGGVAQGEGPEFKPQKINKLIN
jgi:hypothetical protein